MMALDSCWSRPRIQWRREFGQEAWRSLLPPRPRGTLWRSAVAWCGFSTRGAFNSGRRLAWLAWPRLARLRVSFRIRRHALASGQLHRAGVVSSLAPLAPTGLGPVSYHARGAAELRGVSAVLPGNPGCPPRVSPRSLGPDPGSCRGHDPRAQFWPVLSGFPALDQRTGILLLSGPRAMEPGNRPGPVDPGGKGAGSLSRLAEAGTIPGMADRPFGGLDSRRARADRAGPGQRLSGRASLVSRPLSEGFSVASLDGRLQSPRRAGRSPQAGGRPEDFRGKPSRDLRANWPARRVFLSGFWPSPGSLRLVRDAGTCRPA